MKGQDTPSDRWGAVQLSDVGSGFKALFDPVQRLELTKALERASGKQPTSSRFIHGGESRFISVYFKPVKRRRKPDRQPKKPMGAEAKPTPQQTANFRNKLDKNIKCVSNFMLDDLAPFTLAVESAIDRTRAITAQWIDDPLDVPRTFIRRKAEEAVHLRITRFVSDYFDLNDRERTLLLSEFERKTLI